MGKKLCEHGWADRYENGRCRACKRASKARRRLLVGPTLAYAEQRKRWNATPNGRATYMLRQMRKRSAEKGMDPPTVTAAWIAARLRGGVCELSGLPFRRGAGPRSPFSASIDRRDSRLPYTEENCRVVLWALNSAMGEWGEDAFAPIARAWLERRYGPADLVG